MCNMTPPCRGLSGSRVRLRPFDAKTDAEGLFGICRHEETVRFYGMAPMESIGEAEELLESYAKGGRAGTSVHWAIVDAATGELIGDAGLMSINCRNHRASSYCILEAGHWGRGLSRDAMKMVFDHAFSSTELNRIHAYIDGRNERTIRSVRGIGFIQEGVLREYEKDRGEFIDDAVFALTRLDWCKVRHTVFGARARQARERLSWQFYSLEGEEWLWIYDGDSRLYHLLPGVEAAAWLKTAEPKPLPREEGMSASDPRACRFMARLHDAGVVYEVHWDVTNACNSRCRHCYNHGGQNGQRNCLGAEMSADECREMLTALREAGVFRIVFSGGEPLVRKDILELIRTARGLGFQVVLYTNGLAVDEECANSLSKLGLVSVAVSAYGARAATHDGITGIRGSFDKSMNALRLLTERGVHTVMKCVALHSNVAELDALRELGGKVAEHTLVNYVFYPGLDGGGEINGQMMRMSEIVALSMDPRSELHAEKSSRQLCRYEPGRDHVCTRVLRSLYVNPQGDVFPCIAIPCSGGKWRDVVRSMEQGRIDMPDVLKYWRDLRFSDIPLCGTRDYCAFCYSVCPGDGLLVNGDEHVPPTNHCRLAIGRYAASRWLASRRTPDEWKQCAAAESFLSGYLESLGISKAEYVVGGVV